MEPRWKHHDNNHSDIYPDERGKLNRIDEITRGVGNNQRQSKRIRARKLLVRGSLGINEGLVALIDGPISMNLIIVLDKRGNDSPLEPYEVFEGDHLTIEWLLKPTLFVKHGVEDRFEIIWEKRYMINMTFNKEVVPPPYNVFDGGRHAVEEYIDLNCEIEYNDDGVLSPGKNRLYMFTYAPTLNEGWSDPVWTDLRSRLYFDDLYK